MTGALSGPVSSCERRTPSSIRAWGMRAPSREPRGGSVPRAVRAVPVDVAREPFGADHRHQPLDGLRAARRAGRAGLRRDREILLEARVAQLAPVFVDRY